MDKRMNKRRDFLAVDEVYHVFNRSIAGFKIFNNTFEFSRMMAIIRYYQNGKPPIKFSRFIKLLPVENRNYNKTNPSDKEKLVEIIAYCLMPTHLHLILKQLRKNGISTFMRYILNSYTRYFNIKHNRKGPLWEGRFRRILVETDEQLLHLTRYIHLNPVTANLIDRPEKWIVSSYQEYLSSSDDRICEYENVLDIKPNSYRKFVEDRVVYQKELARIKDLIIE